MKLMVSAGGTGGGIYPALAVVAAMRTLDPTAHIHFVGSAAGLENELIHAAGVPLDAYDTVQAGPVHGVNPLRLLDSLARLTWGSLQAIRLLWRHRPEAIFLTGGWVGLPVALAGWLFRVPIVIFVPDIEPGLTLKVLGRFARLVTATTADTQQFFPGRRLVATGYPLRADLMQATREKGRASFGLDAQRPTLLVFGGSRGARSINEALIAQAAALVQELGLQVIHVTGTLDYENIRARYEALPATVQAHYQLYDYRDDLGQAMAAADLVLSRAGASTLGEFPYFGLPAVLVPYPHAWRYQKVNADWLVERGAALRLDDEALASELLPTLRQLLNAEGKRAAMAASAQALAQADGAENIARVLLNVKKP